MSTTGPIVLRAPEASEIEGLNALCFRSKAHWGYDEDFMEACRPVLQVDRDALSDGRVQIAHIDGAVAGVAQFSVERSRAELDLLFVEPNLMGSGAGRALFDWACGAALKRHAVSMTILSDPGARAFYENMGAVYEEDAPSDAVPGRTLPRLRKDLFIMTRLNIKRR